MVSLPHAPEIDAQGLVDLIDGGQDLQIIDVRAPHRVAAGRIDLVPTDRFHNIVGSSLIKMADPRDLVIDPAIPTTVVCGRGNDSRVLALHLNHLGFDARSLTGGMSAWMSLATPRELPTTPSLDHFYQFDRVGKGALGYVLVSDGQAVVVDPPRDFEPFLLVTEELEARVVAVLDTHVHADYISGATSLSQFLDIPYYLHPDDAVYPYDGTPGRLEFIPLQDGGRVTFGRSALHAMHTPGHTEGSLTYTIDDSAALTGDFVFVGSIGRPDLAGKTAAWAEQLWLSLTAARERWSPNMTIYPAHYSGDSERTADRTVAGRFGDMLEHNRSLQFETRADFLRWIDSASAPLPEAYARIKAVNVGLMPVTDVEAEELELGRNECALGGS